MKGNQRRSLIKKLSFYCPGIDCDFTKIGFNRKGGQKYICGSCERTFGPLKKPIDFSTWTDIDKALDKELHLYYLWKRNFDRLKAFYEKYGHTWPSKESKGKSRVFPNWVSCQRTAIRRGTIHPLKAKLLRSINFISDYYGNTDKTTMAVRRVRTASRNPFPDQFKKVLAWKNKYGRWPNGGKGVSVKERELAVITSKWRTNGSLYADEMDLLDSLGFIWNIYDEMFRLKIERFKAFKKKFGCFYLIDSKNPTDYDRRTSYLISLIRCKPPKCQWRRDQIKALKLGTLKDRVL
jgi:hypothetical protein